MNFMIIRITEKMTKKYLKLFKRFFIISWQNIYVFKFEFLMVFLNLFFNFSFIFIFWYTLLNHIPKFNGWTFEELAIYTSIVFMGEGLSGFFFGFRDLPHKIINGELDKFLCRPINTLIAILFEQVSVIYFIEQFIVSIIISIFIIIKYHMEVSILNVIYSFIILFIGILILNFIYGIITFLTFWCGRLETFREIIMQVAESKHYPVTIFPKKIRFFLTYCIPTALVSYYPSIVFLGKEKFGLIFLIKFLILLLIIYTLFILTWKGGIKRYESNGG